MTPELKKLVEEHQRLIAEQEKNHKALIKELENQRWSA